MEKYMSSAKHGHKPSASHFTITESGSIDFQGTWMGSSSKSGVLSSWLLLLELIVFLELGQQDIFDTTTHALSTSLH